MDESVRIHDNAAWAAQREPALLSICVPFYRYNVAALAQSLIRQALPLRAAVEIVFADDGSADEVVAEGLRRLFEQSTVPMRLAVFARNRGRAMIRNSLASLAQGRYALYIDSDMLPDTDDFVARYLELARGGQQDIVVGGCSYNKIERVAKSKYLDWYHGLRAQCAPLETRQKSPSKYVFTNNVMIRRDALLRMPFDEGYIGWGYEDTDWAFAAARAGAVTLHIHNTASHLGLVDDAGLIRKHREAGVNYLRLAQKFPLETQELPVFRAVRLVSRLPLPFTALSEVFASVVRATFIPVLFRRASFRCFRISLYSGLCRQR